LDGIATKDWGSFGIFNKIGGRSNPRGRGIVKSEWQNGGKARLGKLGTSIVKDRLSSYPVAFSELISST
jgi:hypothetical protein